MKDRIPVDRTGNCLGKVRFDSLVLARRVARRGKGDERRGREPYHCAFCRGWHIGRLYMRAAAK